MENLGGNSLTRKIFWITLSAIVIASVVVPVYAAKPQKTVTNTLELVQVRLIVDGKSIVLSPSELIALPKNTSFYVEADVKNTSANTINVRVQFYFSTTQTLNSDIDPGQVKTFASKNFRVAAGYNTLTVTAQDTLNGSAKLQTNTIFGS